MSDDTETPDPRSLIPADGARVVLCTAPPAKARPLAATLVEERLAACVNLVPGLRSIYRWKADVHDDPETLLIIKTTAEQLDALATRLVDRHPYEVPEVLALTPDQGLAGYLAWLGESVGSAQA